MMMAIASIPSQIYRDFQALFNTQGLWFQAVRTFVEVGIDMTGSFKNIGGLLTHRLQLICHFKYPQGAVYSGGDWRERVH